MLPICLPLADVWEDFKSPRIHQNIQEVDKLEEARLSNETKVCQLSAESSHAWSHCYFQSLWQTCGCLSFITLGWCTCLLFSRLFPRYSPMCLYLILITLLRDESYVIQCAGSHGSLAPIVPRSSPKKKWKFMLQPPICNVKTVCLVGASLLLTSASEWTGCAISYYETALFWSYPKITMEEIIFTNKIRQIWKCHTWGNTNDLIIQHPDGNDKNPSSFAFQRKYEIVALPCDSLSVFCKPPPFSKSPNRLKAGSISIQPRKFLVFHKTFPL